MYVCIYIYIYIVCKCKYKHVNIDEHTYKYTISYVYVYIIWNLKCRTYLYWNMPVQLASSHTTKLPHIRLEYAPGMLTNGVCLANDILSPIEIMQHFAIPQINMDPAIRLFLKVYVSVGEASCRNNNPCGATILSAI